MQNVSVPHFTPETILFDKDRRTNMTEENRNALVQRNDRLIRDVIQKAEKECKSAVALIAMYGSFCTGRYSETSDLDLFVLMRNEDGYKACVTFILGGCGTV
ncbi:nucleotidyltransferase domain-containing protein [Hominenteromicrobium sp.]|uniref:nucleotidyltransferase domain-containing protein n=1 Tax=Hominenteromicrobium sp. TaxID=3073581 RepID=UPI003A930E1B